jgi:hypothetical protein
MYRIVVEGELSDRFVAGFGDMHLERRSGNTSLTGEIPDQAQLQGILAHVADLGLSLVSVGPVVSGKENTGIRPDFAEGRTGPDL